MKYLINSNQNYSSISLKKIIPSLIACGIDPKDILVIIGGCENESAEFFIDPSQKFQCLNTQINALDQTAFFIIEKYENFFDQNYYFYLHDTTFAGPNFKNNIDKICVKSKAIKLTKDTELSCNLGIYHKKYLLEFIKNDKLFNKHRKILCNINDPYNQDQLKLKKQISFELEDRILKNLTKEYMCERRYILGKQDVYNTGNDRVICYFKEIDLYKACANIGIGALPKSIEFRHLSTFLGCKI